MARKNEPDVDFAHLMARQGVTPLAERAGGSRAKSEHRAPPPATPAGAPPGEREAAQTALLLGARDEIRRLEAALSAAQLRAETAETRAAAAEASLNRGEALRASRQATSEAQVRVEQAAADLSQARAETSTALRRAEKAEARLSAVETELSTARALLEEAAAARPEPEPLDDLLTRAGLHDPAVDFAALVATLAAHGRLGDLLRRLRVVPSSELAHYFDDRVAWLCAGCTPASVHGTRTIVAVPPVECDVCGGSSVQAAAARFAEACRATRVERVLLVGGSPAYHDLLQKLEPTLGVRLRIIRGDAHSRDKARAQQDLAGADVVFIWASTVLDHRVSDLYTGAKVQTLPVRGLARMLATASERLRARKTR
jgi:hypothetical protein